MKLFVIHIFIATDSIWGYVKFECKSEQNFFVFSHWKNKWIEVSALLQKEEELSTYILVFVELTGQIVCKILKLTTSTLFADKCTCDVNLIPAFFGSFRFGFTLAHSANHVHHGAAASRWAQ